MKLILELFAVLARQVILLLAMIYVLVSDLCSIKGYLCTSVIDTVRLSDINALVWSD